MVIQPKAIKESSLQTLITKRALVSLVAMMCVLDLSWIHTV